MTVRFYKQLPDEIYLTVVATMDEYNRHYWLEDETDIHIEGYIIKEDASKLVKLSIEDEIGLPINESFYFILVFDTKHQYWSVVTDENVFDIDVPEETLRSVMEGKGVPS